MAFLFLTVLNLLLVILYVESRDDKILIKNRVVLLTNLDKYRKLL